MFRQYEYRIIGMSPLLMHSPATMSIGGVKRKQIPPPEEEAEKGTYRDTEGRLIFPAIAFRNALLKTATSYKFGKKSLKYALAHIRVAEEYVLLLDPDTDKPLTEYTIDVRRAVIQGDGILRARPRLDKWACNVSFLGDEEIAGSDLPALILRCLVDAGKIIGVGDYRLERGGWFGLFQANLV